MKYTSNKFKRYCVLILVLSFCGFCLPGCWLVAAGAGAEAGYIVAQEDRDPGETIDDQLIVTSVKAKLLADPVVSGFDINVDSFKGLVTLKGVLESQREIDKAIEIAHSVDGVNGVQSNLYLER